MSRGMSSKLLILWGFNNKTINQNSCNQLQLTLKIREILRELHVYRRRRDAVEIALHIPNFFFLTTRLTPSKNNNV